MVKYGSSPRMRGKPASGPQAASSGRIIPAHAGQTSPAASASGALTDHPRACGANCLHAVVADIPAGSSPRMRGKRDGVIALTASYRIIPAHAGQTRQNTAKCTARADHPRACGANGRLGYKVTRITGSSPRMRGKQHHRHLEGSRDRIIPAHAGQTD